MAELYIVRHAQVNIDFSIPSTEWHISEDGIRATRDLVLREDWSGVHCIYHSPEPKAVATADIISEMTGIPTSVMDELHELRIPTIQPTEEFIRRSVHIWKASPTPNLSGHRRRITLLAAFVASPMKQMDALLRWYHTGES